MSVNSTRRWVDAIIAWGVLDTRASEKLYEAVGRAANQGEREQLRRLDRAINEGRVEVAATKDAREMRDCIAEPRRGWIFASEKAQSEAMLTLFAPAMASQLILMSPQVLGDSRSGSLASLAAGVAVGFAALPVTLPLATYRAAKMLLQD